MLKSIFKELTHLKSATLLFLICLVFEACTTISETPVPTIPSYINTVDDHYICKAGASIALTPLSNDSVSGPFIMKMLKIRYGSVKVTKDTMFYEAPVNFNGDDSIVYQLQNEKSTKTGLIVLSITSDCVPVLNNDFLTMQEGTVVQFNPAINDSICSSAYSISILAANTNTAVTAAYYNNGLFSFSVPYGKYEVTDHFTYTVRYNNGVSYSAQINVLVTPDSSCASRLQANPDTASTTVNSQLIIPYNVILNNDRFCPSDAPYGNINVESISQYGTITSLQDGIVFTPNANSRGRMAELNYSIYSERFHNIISRSVIRINIR